MGDWTSEVEAALQRGEIREGILIAFRSDYADRLPYADPETMLTAVQYFLRQPLKDLACDAETRQKVRISLVLSMMNCETSAQAGRRLLKAIGGSIPCPELVDWLSMDDEEEDPEPSPHEVAQYYCWRRLGELETEDQLQTLLHRRTGRGIKILAAPNPGYGQLCENGDIDTPWSAILDLPRLPCGWGCRCCYVAML